VRKGTYIRSLAATWRCLGHCRTLVGLAPTRAGPFTESQPFRFPSWRPSGIFPALFGVLAPVATALDDIPALALTETQADRLRQGQPVFLPGTHRRRTLLRAEFGSRLVALVRSDGAVVKPVRVFNL